MGDDTIISLLKDSIIDLCRANAGRLTGKVDIDGIVCISGENSSHQIVVKVHEQFQNDSASRITLADKSQPRQRDYKKETEYKLNKASSNIMGRAAMRKRKRTTGMLRDSRPDRSDEFNSEHFKETGLLVEEEYTSRKRLGGLSFSHSNSTGDKDSSDCKPTTDCGHLDSLLDLKHTAEDFGDDSQHDFIPTEANSDITKCVKIENEQEYQWSVWPNNDTQSPRLSDPEDEDPVQYESIDATYLPTGVNDRTQMDSSYTETNTPPQKIKKQYNYGNQKGTFPCPYCEKIFGWQRTLMRHINKHMDNRPYVCKHCKKSFHRRDFLRYHIVTHIDPEPHKCGVCLKTFALRKSTLAHIKKFHNVPSTEACVFCFGVFPSDVIASHVQEHDIDNMEQLTCDFCGFVTKSKYQMLEHSIYHFPTYESNNALIAASSCQAMMNEGKFNPATSGTLTSPQTQQQHSQDDEVHADLGEDTAGQSVVQQDPDDMEQAE